MDSFFENDLGADSFDLVEMIIATEEKLKITIEDDDSEKLKTVRGVVSYIFLNV